MRGWIAGLFGLLTVLLVLPATVTATVRPMLVDTEHFVAALAPLAEDASVQQAVANRIVVEAEPLVDALAERMDTGATTEQLARAAARTLLTRAATAVTGSEAFAALWRGALTLTHSELIAPLATGDPGRITRIEADGTLGIDLTPVLDAVTTRAAELAGVTDSALLDRLPSEVVLPVASSDALAELTRWTPVAARSGIWLPIGVGALAVATVLVARHRRRALAVLSLATAALCGVALLLVALVRRAAVEAAEGAVQPTGAVGVLLDTAVGGLRGVWLILGAVTLVLGLGALILRRRRPHPVD